ncbi:hypothetical protein AB0M43_18505 [Longispora sp. NPDC051575]|uniref:hypothetical protein n=1 Tax=Longispora sp. NPDC051575 TaxID=3154943 RepID=UPI00343F85C7
MVGAPTTMRVLLSRRHWQRYETFLIQFERTAKALAEQEGNGSLARLTVSQRQFERWYAGVLKTLPRPDQCRVLEAMFALPIAELLAPHDLAEIAEKRTLPAVAEPLDLERQVTMAARRALRFTALAESSSVGPETVAQLHDEISRLAAAYPRQPLSEIMGDLVEVQDLLFQLLDQGRVRPNQARDLYLLAGIGTGMLAKASHDLGDARSAMTQARAAFVCADNADHPGLRAWTRGLQSLISYWAGQPEHAVRYAELGMAAAEQVAGTSRTWLACLAARAHATLGDVLTTSALVRTADASRDQLIADDLDAYGGIMTFAHPRQLYYTAAALAQLPDKPAGTLARAEESVRAYEQASPDEWAFGDQAGARNALAVVRLSSGDLDGAVGVIGSVLDMPVEQRIHGVLVSVRKVHTTLCESHLRNASVARIARQEIETFTATSARSITA